MSELQPSLLSITWKFFLKIKLKCCYCTAKKMKFSIMDFFSKCDQISSLLRIWSHLLKKYLMENFIFCAVLDLLSVKEIELSNNFAKKRLDQYEFEKILLCLHIHRWKILMISWTKSLDNFSEIMFSLSDIFLCLILFFSKHP